MTEQAVQEIPVAPSNAFQAWIGQWRLNTLDSMGCSFVLRFVLSAFRSKRPDDRFWSFLTQFFGITADSPQTTRALLTRAGVLEPEGARALLDHLSQSYAAPGERFFWSTVSEAIQLYMVAPFERREASA